MAESERIELPCTGSKPVALTIMLTLCIQDATFAKYRTRTDDF